jgi:asparagine synthase (glutamine-hydrolysing)
MCGIYGLVRLDCAVERGELERQRDLLIHRGPDDAGVWISDCGRVGLAHRRLSIIDLTPGGHQPMLSADGRLAIAYNGEIYNYRELRRELEKSGFVFASESDTEVILAAYRAWGEQCLTRFNGMFAFAIYDRGDGMQAPALFFARDRAGKKPFYYSMGANRFEFASEPKALASRAGIGLAAVNHYLALGYVPGELSLFDNVRKLPPGHYARIELPALKLKVARYWQLPDPAPAPNADGTALAGETQRLLADAVRLRLVADVPVGVLLSGGLDSSLIVAAAAQQSSQPVRTFTVAQPGSPLDESWHARRIAEYFATEHHELALDRLTLQTVEEMAAGIDEPIADSSLIPTFLISKLTRKHVTVVLGGDGGDELFGGYANYLDTLRDIRRLDWLPRPLLRVTAAAAAALPAGWRGRNRVAALRGGPLEQMIWGTAYFDSTLRSRLFTADARKTLGDALEAPEERQLELLRAGRDPLDRMTRAHFNGVLPDDYLVKVDRASMAHGLEMRSPFLDHQLAEFAARDIPSEWKCDGRETRRVQKLLARRLLPAGFDAARKQGFSIPLDDWLRAERCATVRHYVDYLPTYCRRDTVEQLIAGQLAGRANGARLYALLMLGIALKNAAAHAMP